MEHEVKRERAEIEECGEETPILCWRSEVVELTTIVGLTNLILVEHSAEAVEELEGRYDLALHERGGENGCCRPPAGAEGHFPEPGLEGEAGLPSNAATSCADHLVHDFVFLLKKL